MRTRRARPDILRVGSLRPGVIGNTPASGAGFRGSSPWGAVLVLRFVRAHCEHQFAMSNAENGKPLPASRKRVLISAMLAEGLSQAEVGRRLGLARPTVSYHARRLGIPARDECSRRYDWNEIQIAYDAGLTVRECARRFGFATCSWHEAVKRGDIRPRPRRMPIEDTARGRATADKSITFEATPLRRGTEDSSL